MADFTLMDYFERRKGALKKERQSFLPHYQDLSDHVQPRRGRFVVQDRNRGTKRHQAIINSKATQSLRVARAGMVAGTMSPSQPWFRVETANPEFMESQRVREWLHKQEELLRAIFASSNFYNMAPQMVGELLLFGTGCMTQVDDFEDVARFYTHTAGSYMIAQDERYVVNTLIREQEYTVEQLVGWFGYDNQSMTVKGMWDKGDIANWIPTTHIIEPNPDANPNSEFAEDGAFRSVYYETGSTDKERFLNTSGFREFPAYVPRWDVTGEDVYGTDCPGMTSLGDVRGLQIEEKRKAQAIDKMVNPPLKGPAELQNVPVNSLPGGLTIYSGIQGREGLQPIYTVNPNLQDLKEDMARVERRIEEAFYVDMFLAISQMEGIQPRNQLDLAQRNQERLLQLGPVLERIHGEFLSRLIERTFAQGVRAGIIAGAPPEIEGQEINVRFISNLAMAQRAVATQPIERLTQFVGQLAQFNPEVLDKYDFDQSVDEYAKAIGSPPSLVVSDEQVAATRAERQKAAQAQAEMEAAQSGAGTLKDLSAANAEVPQ
jgi:hypothetical protein